MLDDLDKLVPKLDENDKDKMYKNINKKINPKREKRINKGFVLAFAAVALILAVLIPVGIVMSNQNKANKKPSDIITTPVTTTPIPGNDPTGNDPTDNVIKGNINLDANNFLGYVAHNAFDKKGANTKGIASASNELFKINSSKKSTYFIDTAVDDKSQYNISYPYDYIKIFNATRFKLEINDISDAFAKETIEANCGFGEIDIVVANFDTYINENGKIVSSIGDTLISFRGHNGFYTILENGCSYEYGGTSLQTFSSHKKLTSDSVDKDLTGTILTIFVKNDINKRYVSFKSSDDTLDDEHFDESNSFMYEGTIEEVSSSELYSVLELNELPVKTIRVKVLAVNFKEKTIDLEETDSNLRTIIVNEKNMIYKLRLIKPGYVLIISYVDLFDEYDPVIITPDKIEVEIVEDETKNTDETENKDTIDNTETIES